jgi:hypothetical protein
MKIKFPKKITILACEFIVKKDKKTSGGSFNMKKGEIIIGTEFLGIDDSSVFNVICHEVMEIILALLSLRYHDGSVSNNYKFFMDHKEFQTSIVVFADTIKHFME